METPKEWHTLIISCFIPRLQAYMLAVHCCRDASVDSWFMKPWSTAHQGLVMCVSHHSSLQVAFDFMPQFPISPGDPSRKQHKSASLAHRMAFESSHKCRHLSIASNLDKYRHYLLSAAHSLGATTSCGLTFNNIYKYRPLSLRDVEVSIAKLHVH
jgi:hypothetical protein